tara:strand:- start:503 stop:1165 length:663 start_codon:yes stop_codon:yes gene_type:complete
MSTSIPPVVGATNIQAVMFIKLGPIEGNVYYVANTYKPYTVGGNSYTALGSLVGLGDISDELRVSNGDVGVIFAGIPTDQDYVSLVLNSKVKGAPIEIMRGFVDSDGELEGGVAYTRFKGTIINTAISETRPMFSEDTFHTVTLQCSNINSILEHKIAGRKTNKAGMQEFYATDGSWNRTAILQSTAFEFGKGYGDVATGSAGSSSSNGQGSGYKFREQR